MRYYLVDPAGRFAKFFHIDQVNPKTQHLYIPGEQGSPPRLLAKHPSMILRPEELSNVRYSWSAFQPYSEELLLDYISFHPEEMCFRFQLRGDEHRSIEQKFSESDGLTGFMDYMLFGEDLSFYRLETKAKSPNQLAPAPLQSQLPFMHGTFSLETKDARTHPFLGKEVIQEVGETGKVVQAWAYGKFKDLDGDFLSNKPKGTIFSVLFPLRDGTYLSESYIIG